MMAANNEKLLQTAREAIQAYHGDTSVSQETTLDGLEELQSELVGMIDAIKADIKSSGG